MTCSPTTTSRSRWRSRSASRRAARIRRAASLSEAEAIVNEAQAAFRVYLTDDTTPLLEAALFDPLPLAAVRNALPGNVWDLLVSESLAIMEYPEVRLSEPERRFLDHFVEVSLP